eukprot:388255_1
MLQFYMISVVLYFITTHGASKKSVKTREGFVYPDAMPPPIEAQSVLSGVTRRFFLELEAPIQGHIISGSDIVYWNCLAVYTLNSYDFVTRTRPEIVADEETINLYGNEETMMLCSAYAFTIVRGDLLKFNNDYSAKDEMLNVLLSWDLDPTLAIINEDVIDCAGQTNCLQRVAMDNNYEPAIMASIIAYQVLYYVSNDGWNRDGSKTSLGSCTANCRPYRDFTNYYPKNNPYKIDDTKYNDVWAPLLEDDGKGFMFHYDHVVPHIGVTAVTKILSRSELESRFLPDPEYDFEFEKTLVHSRLRDLSTNETIKMLVEHFDDKVRVSLNLYPWTLGIIGDNMGWIDFQVYNMGFVSSLYDCVVQSWLEKRRWDLVRPTTLIKNDGRKIIKTYGGPSSGGGIQTINSFDFETYMRLMPHSEYPSASACICQGITDFNQIFLREYMQITGMLPPINLEFEAGSSINEPGMTPKTDLAVQFTDLNDYNLHCGESRRQGGMHFTNAISGGQQLCKGIGEKGLYLMEFLLEGDSKTYSAKQKKKEQRKKKKKKKINYW